jgi:exosortase
MPITVAPAVAVEQADAAAAPATRLQRGLLLLVAVELAVLYAPTVAWLVDRWTLSVWHNAHGFLIPPAVAYFARHELRPMRHLPRRASAWGFVFVLPALAMHVLDTGMHTQILSAASLVVLLPGLALLFLGAPRTRAIAFPLAFLVFMLPIPLALTESIHLALRQIATLAAGAIVPLFGITVHAEGTSLHLREGVLFVGDACSGFSTLYASAAVAALSAYSCPTTRGRVVTLAAAAPIAIAANVVRVILLVLAARLLGLASLDTWLHPASGLLTFALALPIIFWLGAPSKRRA